MSPASANVCTLMIVLGVYSKDEQETEMYDNAI